MDAQRIRQTVLGIVILVALGFFWQRGGAPDDAETADAGRLNGGAASSPVSVDVPASTVPAPAPKLPIAEAKADFDYYVLVLSWSPTHCSSDAGRGRDDELQCRAGRPYGFVMHGLWPQNERGYPQSCASDQPRVVSSMVMRDALKLSPSEQLIQHEWEKHGTCSGLSQEDYFATAALAAEAIKVPQVYRAPQRPIVTTPNNVRRAFLDANRAIPQDGLSATCSRNELAEVWVCLDKGLHPRACSNDVRKRHCGGREVRMLAVRGDWPR